MIKIQNIQHMLTVAQMEFENNWKEYHQKGNEDFMDLCYIYSRLKIMVKRMEKNGGNTL